MLTQECSSGHHLWTTVWSRSALIQGAKLATRLGDLGAASYYLEQAETIDVATQEFWQISTGHWDATKHPSRRTGLDCAFPLTLIHEEDSNDGNATLHAASPGALATLRHFARSFDNLYHVNSNSSWVEGKVLGRYAEDIYDGVGTSEGNPWSVTLDVALGLSDEAVGTFALSRLPTPCNWLYNTSRVLARSRPTR